MMRYFAMVEKVGQFWRERALKREDSDITYYNVGMTSKALEWLPPGLCSHGCLYEQDWCFSLEFAARRTSKLGYATLCMSEKEVKFQSLVLVFTLIFLPHELIRLS